MLAPCTCEGEVALCNHAGSSPVTLITQVMVMTQTTYLHNHIDSFQGLCSASLGAHIGSVSSRVSMLTVKQICTMHICLRF